MNVLLTGANGFLGKEITFNIKDKCKLFNSSRYNSDFNYDLSLSVPKFDIYFDLVIHAAGLAHILKVDESEQNLFHVNNVKATENLLASFEVGMLPKYFVFISSVSVYGIENGELVNESSELNAIDPYGLSKINAEKLILNWCNKNKIICTIFRLPIIVGKYPKGNLKDMIDFIKKGYFFNISGVNAKKSMVLAEDVAKSIFQVYDIGGIFNLTDGYHPSIVEISNLISLQYRNKTNLTLPAFIVKMFSKIGNLFGRFAPINTKRYNKLTATLTFDDTKARNTFGWNPNPVLSYNYKSFSIKKN